MKHEEVLDDGFGMDHGTWVNFHWACAAVRAFTGHVDRAVQGLRRGVRAGQIWDGDAAEIAAELRKSLGDVRGAIEELEAHRARLTDERCSLPYELNDELVRLYWIAGNEKAACASLRAGVAALVRELEQRDLDRTERTWLRSKLLQYRRALSVSGIARQRRYARAWMAEQSAKRAERR